MILLITVQLDHLNAYLNILFGNSTSQCVLDNIHMIKASFRDVFFKNITWNYNKSLLKLLLVNVKSRN